MSQSMTPPPLPGGALRQVPVAQQPVEVRAAYMRSVYANLLGAIAAFVAFEYFLFATGLVEPIASFVIGMNWLPILFGFMLVSWLATRLATRATTTGKAYAGLALLVVANGVLFATPLLIAAVQAEGAITRAAWLSLFAFTALSAIAMTTSKDFSFLRGILLWGGVLALCAIVGSVIFGAQLGTWFAVAMIGFAGAAILYDTQKVYRAYPPGTEIIAAMQLFSSIALLFWYVLQLFTRR